MADKAAHVRAVAKYDKTHTTGIYLKLNNETDKDILDFLETCSNKQGFFKFAARYVIERGFWNEE